MVSVTIRCVESRAVGTGRAAIDDTSLPASGHSITTYIDRSTPQTVSTRGFMAKSPNHKWHEGSRRVSRPSHSSSNTLSHLLEIPKSSCIYPLHDPLNGSNLRTPLPRMQTYIIPWFSPRRFPICYTTKVLFEEMSK
jgi:hypothetical protein